MTRDSALAEEKRWKRERPAATKYTVAGLLRTKWHLGAWNTPKYRVSEAEFDGKVPEAARVGNSGGSHYNRVVEPLAP